MATRASRWPSIVRCCHPQPPHPARRDGHGGTTRCGEASRTSSAWPRAQSFFSVVSSTVTVSPGSAPRTNTMRPPSSRAIASPPAANRSGRSVSDGHRGEATAGTVDTDGRARSFARSRTRSARTADPDRPVGAARRLRPPRRRGDGARQGGRRPHPVGRDGRPVRAQPHVRARRHPLGPLVDRPAVRGPPDGVHARADGRALHRGRVPAPDRPRRGLHPPAPRARPDRRARRGGRRRPQPGDPGRAPSPTSSTSSSWCW